MLISLKKQTDFYEKLRKINNKVNSTKTRYIEAEKKLNNLDKTNNDLLGELKLKSTKGLTKDFINGYILNVQNILLQVDHKII